MLLKQSETLPRGASRDTTDCSCSLSWFRFSMLCCHVFLDRLAQRQSRPKCYRITGAVVEQCHKVVRISFDSGRKAPTWGSYEGEAYTCKNNHDLAGMEAHALFSG